MAHEAAEAKLAKAMKVVEAAREIGSMKIDGREIAKLRDALREFDESQEKPNED